MFVIQALFKSNMVCFSLLRSSSQQAILFYCAQRLLNNDSSPVLRIPGDSAIKRL